MSKRIPVYLSEAEIKLIKTLIVAAPEFSKPMENLYARLAEEEYTFDEGFDKDVPNYEKDEN